MGAKMIRLDAAADYLGVGAIEVNMYEKEIMDLVRRSTPALKRLGGGGQRANGHPHRFFEETSIGTAVAVDPRNIASAATGPTRVERSVPIKAAISQTNVSQFDKDVTEQQGQFAYVVGKDIEDTISAVELKRASMLWIGTDTSLSAPTTLEWMGGLTQITQQATIAPGASIIDGLKSQVAAMIANETYDVRPTAIYVNPILGDYIDQEARASHIELQEMEISAGVVVNALNTQAGRLPLIPDVYLPKSAGAAYGFGAPPAGNNNYFAVIVSEKEVEIPYISGAEDNPNPRLFQLGLTGNLAGQFVGIKFDAVVFKGATYAHSTVAVVRP